MLPQEITDFRRPVPPCTDDGSDTGARACRQLLQAARKTSRPVVYNVKRVYCARSLCESWKVGFGKRLTNDAIWTARRPVGTDQGLASGPAGPCRRDCQRQPSIRRGGALSLPRRDPLARSAGALRRLEEYAQALQPLGQDRRLATDLRAF